MTRFTRPSPTIETPPEERAAAYAERLGHTIGQLRATITTIEIFGLEDLDEQAHGMVLRELTRMRALVAELDAEHAENMARNYRAAPTRLSPEARATPIVQRILKGH